MNRKLIGTFAMMACVGAMTSWVWGASRIPARATFRDAVTTDPVTGATVPPDRIRSDGFGAYQDGLDCATTWVQSNMFFLRTYSSACANSGTPPSRRVTLDFSDAVRRPAGADCSSGVYLVEDAYGQPGALNICGSNDLPDVRVIVTSLFAKAAPTNRTPVSLPFSLAPDFSHTAFELDFEQKTRGSS